MGARVWITENFYLVQMGLGFGALAIIAWLWGGRTPPSQFRAREHELRKPGTRGKQADDLAKAKLKTPAALPGIRTDGLPHEILGVSPQASAAEIQKAYRDLMKRYHPDKVAPPGTPAWADAQAIAEAINRAKEKMLKSR